MKLTTETLPLYFTIATPANSHYTEVTNCFDFVSRNSKTLVVTVGDSWTRGEDLDSDLRLQQVYGNIVSQCLSADFLNLGQSGSNNFFIAERVEELGRILHQLDYATIYLICTFTETGRSFNSHHDVYIDYVNWFQNNHIKDFLAFLNNECYNRILRVVRDHQIVLRIGTNFVDAVGFESDLTSWFRQLGISCSIQSCVGSTGANRLKDVEQFIKNQTQFKRWYIDLIDKSKHTDQVCSSRRLINAHPTAEGHKIWANCILESIQ